MMRPHSGQEITQSNARSQRSQPLSPLGWGDRHPVTALMAGRRGPGGGFSWHPAHSPALAELRPSQPLGDSRPPWRPLSLPVSLCMWQAGWQRRIQSSLRHVESQEGPKRCLDTRDLDMTKMALLSCSLALTGEQSVRGVQRWPDPLL